MPATGLCDRLGIQHPVIQAPIGSATCPELAAAVSEAGGLGSLALSWRTPGQVRRDVARTLALTSRPFLANLVLEWPQLARAEICIELGVSVLSTFWGDPEPYVQLASAAKVTLLHSVGSVEEARAAGDAGVDVIVAQGSEAGGHVRGTTRLARLLPDVVAAVDPLPVVAAGGIATVEDARRAMAMGATGVWVGTRFICCEEAAVNPAYQKAILGAAAGDTLLTRLFNKGWENAPHRVIINSTVRAWREAGEPRPGERPGEDDIVAFLPPSRPVERYSDVIPVRGARGDVESLALYAGESSARVCRVLPAADIVRELATAFG